MSLMYLSSYLKSKYIDVKILDKCINKILIKNICKENPYIQELLQDIKNHAPDIIGMTLFSCEIKETAILCKLFKMAFNSALIVLGGPHPTAMPQETLEQIPDCDIITRGESELIFYELIQGLLKNKDLHKVKGISFRSGGKIYHCENGDIVTNLDSLPFPDRENVIQNYRNGTYGDLFYGSPLDIVMTSRGCPFQCNFCFKVCNKYRARSPENVLKEIDWVIKNIAPVNIQIMDDSFTIERSRCVEVLDALIKKNYRCNFRVRSRVNVVDDELLKKMKQAGVTTIVYGLESGSQKMLNAFNKQTTVEQNLAACEMAKRAGLNCFADIVLFYPGETKTTLKETEKFVQKAKPTAIRFHLFTPLPNTKAYNEAKKSGQLVGNWDGSGPTPWVKIDSFTGLDEMERYVKRLFIRNMVDPMRIVWLIRSFGLAFIRNPNRFIKTVFLNLFLKAKY